MESDVVEFLKLTRQAKVAALIRRTSDQWALIAAFSLVLHGAVVCLFMISIGSDFDFFQSMAGVVAAMLMAGITASLFRGNHYYTTRYNAIWREYEKALRQLQNV